MHSAFDKVKLVLSNKGIAYDIVSSSGFELEKSEIYKFSISEYDFSCKLLVNYSKIQVFTFLPMDYSDDDDVIINHLNSQILGSVLVNSNQVTLSHTLLHLLGVVTMEEIDDLLALAIADINFCMESFFSQ